MILPGHVASSSFFAGGAGRGAGCRRHPGSDTLRGLRLIQILLATAASAGFLNSQEPAFPMRLSLDYQIEWRLIDAGKATVNIEPTSARVHVQSAGLVSKLYRVDDRYQATFDQQHLCTASVNARWEEGSKRRETSLTFDKETKRSSYLERDLVKNNIAVQKEMTTPPCLHDVISGLMRLRGSTLKVGQSNTVALSDGKKIAEAKVEAEAQENLKTPLGNFSTTRYRIHIFDGVLYNRKGSLYVWITNDAKRLPIRIRAQFPFYIGTVTLQLAKETSL